MPREIIGSPQGPFHVKVGWSREDNAVQVGVEGDEGRSLFWLLLGESPAQLERLGDELLSATNEHADTPVDLATAVLNALDAFTHSYAGVWADLDRPGCNRLVRTLRKARDDAFGRDE